jgi:ribosomal protein S18 acetylase RimI-like enzyme
MRTLFSLTPFTGAANVAYDYAKAGIQAKPVAKQYEDNGQFLTKQYTDTMISQRDPISSQLHNAGLAIQDFYNARTARAQEFVATKYAASKAKGDTLGEAGYGSYMGVIAGAGAVIPMTLSMPHDIETVAMNAINNPSTLKKTVTNTGSEVKTAFEENPYATTSALATGALLTHRAIPLGFTSGEMVVGGAGDLTKTVKVVGIKYGVPMVTEEKFLGGVAMATGEKSKLVRGAEGVETYAKSKNIVPDAVWTPRNKAEEAIFDTGYFDMYTKMVPEDVRNQYSGIVTTGGQSRNIVIATDASVSPSRAAKELKSGGDISALRGNAVETGYVRDLRTGTVVDNSFINAESASGTFDIGNVPQSAVEAVHSHPTASITEAFNAHPSVQDIGIPVKRASVVSEHFTTTMQAPENTLLGGVMSDIYATSRAQSTGIAEQSLAATVAKSKGLLNKQGTLTKGDVLAIYQQSTEHGAAGALRDVSKVSGAEVGMYTKSGENIINNPQAITRELAKSYQTSAVPTIGIGGVTVNAGVLDSMFGGTSAVNVAANPSRATSFDVAADVSRANEASILRYLEQPHTIPGSGLYKDLVTRDPLLWGSKTEYSTLTPELAAKRTSRINQYGYVATRGVRDYLSNADWVPGTTSASKGTLSNGVQYMEGNGWEHFIFGSETTDLSGKTPKSYVTVSGPSLTKITPETVDEIVTELKKSGFDGQLKFTQMPEGWALRKDNLVLHGGSEAKVKSATKVVTDVLEKHGIGNDHYFGVDPGNGISMSQEIERDLLAVRRKAAEGTYTPSDITSFSYIAKKANPFETGATTFDVAADVKNSKNGNIFNFIENTDKKKAITTAIRDAERKKADITWIDGFELDHSREFGETLRNFKEKNPVEYPVMKDYLKISQTAQGMSRSPATRDVTGLFEFMYPHLGEDSWKLEYAFRGTKEEPSTIFGSSASPLFKEYFPHPGIKSDEVIPKADLDVYTKYPEVSVDWFLRRTQDSPRNYEPKSGTIFLGNDNIVHPIQSERELDLLKFGIKADKPVPITEGWRAESYGSQVASTISATNNVFTPSDGIPRFMTSNFQVKRLPNAVLTVIEHEKKTGKSFPAMKESLVTRMETFPEKAHTTIINPYLARFGFGKVGEFAEDVRSGKVTPQYTLDEVFRGKVEARDVAPFSTDTLFRVASDNAATRSKSLPREYRSPFAGILSSAMDDLTDRGVIERPSFESPILNRGSLTRPEMGWLSTGAPWQPGAVEHIGAVTTRGVDITKRHPSMQAPLYRGSMGLVEGFATEEIGKTTKILESHTHALHDLSIRPNDPKYVKKFEREYEYLYNKYGKYGNLHAERDRIANIEVNTGGKYVTVVPTHSDLDIDGFLTDPNTVQARVVTPYYVGILEKGDRFTPPTARASKDLSSKIATQRKRINEILYDRVGKSMQDYIGFFKESPEIQSEIRSYMGKRPGEVIPIQDVNFIKNKIATVNSIYAVDTLQNNFDVRYGLYNLNNLKTNLANNPGRLFDVASDTKETEAPRKFLLFNEGTLSPEQTTMLESIRDQADARGMGYGNAGYRRIHDALNEPADSRILSMDNGNLMGAISVSYPEGKPFGQIEWLGATVQGKGIGSELVQDAISQMESRGVKSVIVNPSDDAIGFYKKLGFGKVSSGTAKSIDHPTWYMEKKLPGTKKTLFNVESDSGNSDRMVRFNRLLSADADNPYRLQNSDVTMLNGEPVKFSGMTDLNAFPKVSHVVGKPATFYHATDIDSKIVSEIRNKGKATIDISDSEYFSGAKQPLYVAPPETILSHYLSPDEGYAAAIRVRGTPKMPSIPAILDTVEQKGIDTTGFGMRNLYGEKSIFSPNNIYVDLDTIKRGMVTKAKKADDTGFSVMFNHLLKGKTTTVDERTVMSSKTHQYVIPSESTLYYIGETWAKHPEAPAPVRVIDTSFTPLNVNPKEARTFKVASDTGNMATKKPRYVLDVGAGMYPEWDASHAIDSSYHSEVLEQLQKMERDNPGKYTDQLSKLNNMGPSYHGGYHGGYDYTTDTFPFRSNMFGKTVSRGSIHVWGNQHTYDEVFRTTKPGGEFLFNVGDLTKPQSISRAKKAGFGDIYEYINDHGERSGYLRTYKPTRTEQVMSKVNSLISRPSEESVSTHPASEIESYFKGQGYTTYNPIANMAKNDLVLKDAMNSNPKLVSNWDMLRSPKPNNLEDMVLKVDKKSGDIYRQSYELTQKSRDRNENGFAWDQRISPTRTGHPELSPMDKLDTMETVSGIRMMNRVNPNPPTSGLPPNSWIRVASDNAETAGKYRVSVRTVPEKPPFIVTDLIEPRETPLSEYQQSRMGKPSTINAIQKSPGEMFLFRSTTKSAYTSKGKSHFNGSWMDEYNKERGMDDVYGRWWANSLYGSDYYMRENAKIVGKTPEGIDILDTSNTMNLAVQVPIPVAKKSYIPNLPDNHPAKSYSAWWTEEYFLPKEYSHSDNVIPMVDTRQRFILNERSTPQPTRPTKSTTKEIPLVEITKKAPTFSVPDKLEEYRKYGKPIPQKTVKTPSFMNLIEVKASNEVFKRTQRQNNIRKLSGSVILRPITTKSTKSTKQKKSPKQKKPSPFHHGIRLTVPKNPTKFKHTFRKFVV